MKSLHTGAVSSGHKLASYGVPICRQFRLLIENSCGIEGVDWLVVAHSERLLKSIQIVLVWSIEPWLIKLVCDR